MMVCWLLLTSVAVVTARYGKPLLPNTHFFGVKIWFQIHRGCMSLVLGLVILSVLLVVIESGGYSQIPSVPGRQYYHLHPPLGLIVTLLTMANPVMALFRPGTDTANRFVFNWAHWGVGVVAAVLAVVTMFIGMALPKAGQTKGCMIILAIYIVYFVAFIVVVELLPSLLSLIAAKQAKFELNTKLNIRRGSNKTYDVTAPPQPVAPVAVISQPPPTGDQEHRLKCILLLVHYIICAVLTFSMVIALAAS